MKTVKGQNLEECAANINFPLKTSGIFLFTPNVFITLRNLPHYMRNLTGSRIIEFQNIRLPIFLYRFAKELLFFIFDQKMTAFSRIRQTKH